MRRRLRDRWGNMSALTRTHRYPAERLWADYFRAAIGIALTGLPLVIIRDTPIAVAVLGVASALFFTFACRTWLRHRTEIEVTEDAITAQFAGPDLPLRHRRSATLRWRNLSGVRLRFFSTKRDRADGWMELYLTGDGLKVRLDSTIEGFREIATCAASAAAANHLLLSRTTTSNFAAIGIDPAAIQDGGAGS